MDEIFDCLNKLHFSKLEAQIYLALIEEGELSGYQIAKKVHISRSSVYNALESMYEKGMVQLLSKDVQIYIAENPAVLFNRLKNDYSKNASLAESSLTQLYEKKHEERFTNIKGLDTIISNVKELLKNAQKEVYMNTDFEFHLFEDEFQTLRNKGVRILIFSFAALNHDGLDIEFYTHNDPACKDQIPSRMMLVVDCAVTLVADTYKERSTWLGTITNNALMVSIMAEHIHNDIYLLKLKQKYGKNLITEDIKVHTMLENGAGT